MAINFYEYILYMDQIGVADVIWPFLLIFTMVFAMLEKSGVFRWHTPSADPQHHNDSNSRRLSTFVALGMAGMAVFPHITNPGSSYDVIPIINEAMTKTMVWILGAIMVLLLISVFWPGTMELHKGGIMLFIIIGAFLVVTGVFTKVSLGYVIPPWILSSGVVQLIVGVLVVIVVINAITGAVSPTRAAERAKHTREWFDWLRPPHT